MAVQQQNDDDQTNGLFINIVPELRRRITIAARQSNLSIQEYVGHVLEQVVPPETSFTQGKRRGLNRAAVDHLLPYSEEIGKAHPGQVFEDSAETLRQIREERMRELEQQ